VTSERSPSLTDFPVPLLPRPRLVTGDVGMYLVAIIVWAVTIITTLYACALIVLAKIALSLIISVGPLFIISLLFQPTANFFNSWVQQLANYFMLMVLVIAGNVFVLTLFQRAASTTSGITSTAQIDQIFPFLITGGLSLYVLAQIPNMASGLAGGISLSTYGMGRMGLAVFGRGAKSVAGRTSRGIGKGTRKAARAARAAYQGRKRNSVSAS
jgi:type IV secretion system protein VirB6